MEQSSMRLTVLGARGSVPVNSRRMMEFGGSTSCYMVQAAGETIFLDAGSGILFAPKTYEKAPVILLSHMHLDHVLGLGMFPRLSEAGALTRLLLRSDSSADAEAQLAALYAPPFWPLPLTQYAGRLDIQAISPSFRIGEIQIDTLEGRHPGGCLVFRLRCKGKSIVYATDYEPDEISFSELASFSAKADLVLYDAQYTAEEYAKRQGFGHSTAEKGLELLRLSGAAQLLFIHHDPQASDEELLRRERQLGVGSAHYAREGEVIEL